MSEQDTRGYGGEWEREGNTLRSKADRRFIGTAKTEVDAISILAEHNASVIILGRDFNRVETLVQEFIKKIHNIKEKREIKNVDETV